MRRWLLPPLPMIEEACQVLEKVTCCSQARSWFFFRLPRCEAMRTKKYSLHRYLRHLPRHTVIGVSIETHALLVTYAAKHNYSLRQATQRAVAIGLKAEWEREQELAREKKVRELLK